jgi:molecular chaperone Hsp33
VTDLYLPALARDAQLILGFAVTSDVCRVAQRRHTLASLSTVALGRLLTGTALASLIQQRPTTLSLQVVGRGRLRQLFAEATPEGQLRGYVTNPTLGLPLGPKNELHERHTLAPMIGEGQLSVIRQGFGGQFTQSTTALVGSEIDTDIESFFAVSEQVSTVVACDVLLHPDGRVLHAGGVIAQLLPGSDEAELAKFANGLRDSRLGRSLIIANDDAAALMRTLAPEALPAGRALPLEFRCRCSRERVVDALRLLDQEQLADMVAKGESPEVHCDFCGETYRIESTEVASVLRSRESLS